MDDMKVNYGRTPTLLEILQIVFIILKFTKVINWSWWVVLIPIWVELLLIVILTIIFVRKRLH